MKGDSYPSKHFFGIRIWNHIIIQWRTQSLFGKTGTYINPWRRYQSWRRAVNVSKFVLPDALKMHSLALFVLRFLSKTFPKLLKFTLQDTLLGGWFLKIHIFKKKKKMYLWELWSNLGWKDAASGTEGITQSSTNISVV